MHIDLKYKFDSLSEYFEDNGLDFEFKEIPYGMRFSILGGEVQINLYHGKKGFSYVVQGKDVVIEDRIIENPILYFLYLSIIWFLITFIMIINPHLNPAFILIYYVINLLN